MNLTELRGRADEELRALAHARVTLAAERKALKKAKRAARDALQAQQIIQSVAQAVQQKAHEQISKVVTSCIRTVGWDYEFKVEFARKAGRTEARPVFLQDGCEVDPKTAAGGGVVDVAALALRLSCLMLATPARRKALVLDEPFRNVHGARYRKRTVQLLESLAKDTGVQLIVVTGLDWLKKLRTGKVVLIGDDDETTD